MKKNAWWLRSTFAVLALGFVPAAAAEQQPKDTQAPAKEAPAKPDEHAKKLDELMQRLEKARKEFEAKAAALKDDEAALEKLYKEGQPDKAFLAEFQELAKAAKGTETAAKALVQVLWIGGQEDEELAKATVTTLIDEHIASPEIAVLVFLAPYLLGEEEGPKALEKIKAKNTTKPVLAALAFQEVQKLEQEKGDTAPGVRELYTRLAKDFKDLQLPGGGKMTYGEIAEGRLYVLDNLVVGKTAPDFETVDENGVKWKLSDYKGKVVVIDFWGEW